MAKYAGKGTLLKKGNGASPEVFTTIAQIFGGPNGPSMAQEALEVTDHSSPSGFREFIGGLKDGGEVSGELQYDSANATHNASAGLINEIEEGTRKNYQIAFPDASTATFAAVVTAFEPAAPIDGVLTAAFTLKISGVITWA